VWSKGCSQDSRTVIKSFTVDSDVIDCFWCKFTLPLPEEEDCAFEGETCFTAIYTPCIKSIILPGNRLSVSAINGLDIK
jgi:hypothetical protein